MLLLQCQEIFNAKELKNGPFPVYASGTMPFGLYGYPVTFQCTVLVSKGILETAL